MRLKIIIYGLGKIYEKYKEYLYGRFDVVGVTSSNDEEKIKHANYIQSKDIGSIDYDYILICSRSQHEILNKLIDDLKIPKEKIAINNVDFDSKGIFHSQVNEDAICLLLLSRLIKNFRDLTYIDIGTNHPVCLNNTYLFYTLGAKGVLVEPDVNLKNLIETVRPRDTLICKAISVDGGRKEFFKLKNSMLNTMYYDKLDMDFCKNHQAFEIEDKCEIETITINQLFGELAVMPDLMSIDIEGCNYEVLEQMNFCEFRPKIIIAELSAWGEKEQEGEKIVKLLMENNYVQISTNGNINGIFIDKKFEKEMQDFLVKDFIFNFEI